MIRPYNFDNSRTITGLAKEDENRAIVTGEKLLRVIKREHHKTLHILLQWEILFYRAREIRLWKFSSSLYFFFHVPAWISGTEIPRCWEFSRKTFELSAMTQYTARHDRLWFKGGEENYWGWELYFFSCFHFFWPHFDSPRVSRPSSTLKTLIHRSDFFPATFAHEKVLKTRRH